MLSLAGAYVNKDILRKELRKELVEKAIEDALVEQERDAYLKKYEDEDEQDEDADTDEILAEIEDGMNKYLFIL